MYIYTYIFRERDSGQDYYISKAFDCLTHGIFIQITCLYGFLMYACALILKYLSHCQPSVKILNNRSRYKTFSNGVLQGSILSPLLFSVFFINDRFSIIESCNLYNHADDGFMSRSSLDVKCHFIQFYLFSWNRLKTMVWKPIWPEVYIYIHIYIYVYMHIYYT